jgi:hypothetical protein
VSLDARRMTPHHTAPTRPSSICFRSKKWVSSAEFKEFAVKGNVMDLAVGVIIGAAFGKIVDSIGQ